MPRPQTNPSTPRLSEVARHLNVPSGITSTAWPSVRDRCKSFGIGFDPWQHGIGSLSLAKRADGRYAATVGGVVLSIPRQTGKTYLIGWLIFALCTLIPGITVIWTAHHSRTSDETFGKMRAMALRPRVRKYIEGKPRVANGQQVISFKNGSRILFGAREFGFGRGFDEVDVLILDEAQKLTEDAMSDMVPATNAAKNGLVFLMGTPPRPGKDRGEVFTGRRADALSGDPDTVYVEFSAESGATIVDWAELATANPSFPHRTSKSAVLRMQKLLGSDDNFRREAYGIWDEAATESSLVDAATWNALTGPTPMDGNCAYGVRFSADGSRMAMAVAITADDGKTFVEVLDSASTSVGLSTVTPWLYERSLDCDAIVIDGKSMAGLLTEELIAAGVTPRRIVRPGFEDVVTASARLIELIKHSDISHAGQPGLAYAVASAGVRPIGRQGGWGFLALNEDADIPGMEAVALAVSGLKNKGRRPSDDDTNTRRSSGGKRKAQVM